jgi:hypothetical protein
MFNFFKRKQTQEEAIASIQYYVDNTSEKPKLSVTLNDYSPKSIDALCNLIDLIYSDRLALETIGVIQNFLIEAGQEEALIQVLLKLEEKIAKSQKQSSSSPCIKPSDML